MERSIKQYEGDRLEAVKIVSRLLLASGTTAPRVGGVGECTFHTFDDPCDIEDLCQQIEKMAEENESWSFFKRDAAMLRDADSVILSTSLRCTEDMADMNCNLCGKSVCEYMRDTEKFKDELGIAYKGPLCNFRANNIAYAIDGMAWQAKNLGIDHGIYWSVGAAAIRLGLLPRQAGFALGIGISITEKSPFRDIPQAYAEINEKTMNDRIIKRLWPQFRSIYS